MSAFANMTRSFRKNRDEYSESSDGRQAGRQANTVRVSRRRVEADIENRAHMDP